MSPPDVLTISAARDTAALEVLEVEANPGESTFPGEILTCRAPDDGMVRLFRKRSAGAGHDCHGHRAGVAYEAAVYERLLEPIGMSTPAFYGAGVDGDGSWLLIEHLEGAERLNRTVTADAAIVRAAAWIGRFHAAAERLPAATRATLRRYDAEYYAGWSRRTLEYVEDGERRFPWLGELCTRFERDCAPALAHGRLTAIHGELYPRNVLVRGERIHPIDWESAALAPGAIDLVALIDGWDDVHDRALEAYVDERFGGRAPDGFERDCDAARLYLGFRWLGDRPYWTNLESSEYDFRSLHETARRMGLLP